MEGSVWALALCLRRVGVGVREGPKQEVLSLQVWWCDEDKRQEGLTFIEHTLYPDTL